MGGMAPRRCWYYWQIYRRILRSNKLLMLLMLVRKRDVDFCERFMDTKEGFTEIGEEFIWNFIKIYISVQSTQLLLRIVKWYLRYLLLNFYRSYIICERIKNDLFCIVAISLSKRLIDTFVKGFVNDCLSFIGFSFFIFCIYHVVLVSIIDTNISDGT